MIIQIILLAALGAVFIYAITQRRRAFAPAMVMAAISLVGCLLVAAPNFANTLAYRVGVGRGADLILYCCVVLTLGAILNIHLRLRSEHETTTRLARAIAILSAIRPKDDR